MKFTNKISITMNCFRFVVSFLCIKLVIKPVCSPNAKNYWLLIRHCTTAGRMSYNIQQPGP